MLTREEILNEPAGRKLDAWVAEKVMGWTLDEYQQWKEPNKFSRYMQFPPHKAYEMCDNKYFRPSTKIDVAWEVFEQNGYYGSISYMGDEYRCELWSKWNEEGNGEHVIASGDTAPLAITRAALLAVMES